MIYLNLILRKKKRKEKYGKKGCLEQGGITTKSRAINKC